MLSYLKVKNVALIDELTIDFNNGFNVLTGETGAGKSIIIDSLNFVLGNKVNKTLIRSGQTFMKVEALFLPPYNNSLQNILKEYNIEYEDEILIARTYFDSGKSDIRLNGNVLTASMLKNITYNLVDILGQHEHQSLLKEKTHLGIIDNFNPKRLENIKAIVLKNYQSFFEIVSKMKSIGSSSENRERMLDLLKYQIEEIEKANIKADEDIELSNERLKMINSEKIATGLSTAYSELNSSYSSSVDECLKKSSNALNSIVQYDNSLSQIIERINNARYELQDISETIKQISDNNIFDQVQFEKIDSRLDLIKTLKKKYGNSTDEIFNYLKKSKSEYEQLLDSENLMVKLQTEKQNIGKQLYEASLELSNERKNIAIEFENNVMKQLNELGMKNARFKVCFNKIDEIENVVFSPNGLDEVHFEFSANLGQPLKPLSEIISGGEMSRFMLGIKNILADIDNINTLVFDEIDTGISGNIGFTIACKMANISKNHQVISVSHLPQIAAMADSNFLITKTNKDNQTYTYVEKLNENDVLKEIARLSGGEKNSVVSLHHASELRQRCLQYKAQ